MKKCLIPLSVIAVIVFSTILFFSCGRDFKFSWKSVEYHTNELKPRLKVYIENSGSMDGYMCDGSELKDAVYSYVSTLRNYADTLELYYINSQKIAYSGNLQNFIRNLTPAMFKSMGGNHSNSDIGEMFEMMLSDYDNRAVSIFVSDCILDVPQGTAKDFLVNRQIDIRNAIVSALQKDSDIGVEVFRLMSTFTGTYFYDRGSEKLDGEQRPYFMWVIGNKQALAYFNKHVPFSEIKHGFKNYYGFSTYGQVPFEVTDKFGKVNRGASITCKTAFNGQYEIRILTDLSCLLQPQEMIRDISRYYISNPHIQISAIEPLSQNNGKENTHVIILKIDENIRSCADSILFTLPEYPLWLSAVNDTTGCCIKEHLNLTTGIENIVMGVADAYKQHRKLFSIPFVITN